MPYNDPERKRQWEQEHREQRNAKRKTQRISARSGQPNAPKSVSDIVAALRSGTRKRRPTPVSDQKPKSTWEPFIGLAVGVGVVLLAEFAGRKFVQ
jgi:hypothetical protein